MSWGCVMPDYAGREALTRVRCVEHSPRRPREETLPLIPTSSWSHSHKPHPLFVSRSFIYEGPGLGQLIYFKRSSLKSREHHCTGITGWTRTLTTTTLKLQQSLKK